MRAGRPEAVDGDLAAGQARVGPGTALAEGADGVDVDLRPGAQQPGRAQDGCHDQALEVAPELSQVGLGAMVGRDDDGADRLGPVRAVAHRDLDLAVGVEIGNLSGLANVLQSTRQPVGQERGHGHIVHVDGQGAALVGGVAHTDALVAGALAVDAERDIARLLLEHDEHRAAAVVEARGRVVVADPADRGADQARDVQVALGRDLAGDDDHAGGGHDLAGDPGVPVLAQDGVEDVVGDLVADLVGVSGGDRFGGADPGGVVGGAARRRLAGGGHARLLADGKVGARRRKTVPKRPAT